MCSYLSIDNCKIYHNAPVILWVRMKFCCELQPSKLQDFRLTSQSKGWLICYRRGSSFISFREAKVGIGGIIVPGRKETVGALVCLSFQQ